MKFILPIYLSLHRKTKPDKKYSLNINQYYHWHFIIKNNLKTEFEKKVISIVREPEKINNRAISVRYTLFYNTKRKIDLSNICCIVQKFFEDWLVKQGIIEDDNVYIINKVEYIFGGIDKENPRIEAEVIC